MKRALVALLAAGCAPGDGEIEVDVTAVGLAPVDHLAATLTVGGQTAKPVTFRPPSPPIAFPTSFSLEVGRDHAGPFTLEVRALDANAALLAAAAAAGTVTPGRDTTVAVALGASPGDGGDLSDTGGAPDAASSGDGAARGRRLLFVSPTTNGDLGGLASADKFCQMTANTHGHPGAFVAILAVANGTPPSQRVLLGGRAIVRVDGAFVANDEDFFSTIHARPIDVDVDGAQADGCVWTNFDAPGNVHDGQDCNGWASSNSNALGAIGMSSSFLESSWAYANSDNCAAACRLYCIEQ